MGHIIGPHMALNRPTFSTSSVHTWYLIGLHAARNGLTQSAELAQLLLVIHFTHDVSIHGGISQCNAVLSRFVYLWLSWLHTSLTLTCYAQTFTLMHFVIVRRLPHNPSEKLVP